MTSLLHPLTELPSPSIEQKEVIVKIKSNNVIVDSVAGSGKSTVNLHIAKKYPNDSILLLTYNAKLKIETREQAVALDLHNIEVHSYHSMCVKYYDRKCFNDTRINRIIKDNVNVLRHFNYDIIILDEIQDCTALYFQLICKIYRDNMETNTILCILGDRYQSIYDFNYADSRFIQFADVLFNFNNAPWVRQTLSTSFRVPNIITSFINSALLKEDRIKSTKKGFEVPRYLICNTFNKTSTFDEIKYYITLGYKPDEIFVLAASVRKANAPIRLLANMVSSKGFPIYVPLSDTEKLDKDILSKKMVFSTFHQVKGLERKVVLVFNFDNSYFKYYKKNNDPLVCPNELYVATTRTLERLTLFHHFTNDYLPFISMPDLKKTCNIIIQKKIRVNKIKSININTSVTALIRHLPREVIEGCLDYITRKQIQSCDIPINIPTKSEQKCGYENVSDITGTAIPAYFEFKLKGSMGIYERLVDICNSEEIDHDAFKIYNLPDEEMVESNLLLIANLWNSFSSGFIFKLNQIIHYDWLGQDQLNNCMDRLSKLNITSNAQFEVRMELEGEPELLDRKIIGYIDCIDKPNAIIDSKCKDLKHRIIYEFKCTSKLEDVHILQLAIYMYLCKMLGSGGKSFCLFNIMTNESILIKCSLDKLKQMMKYLIYNKYKKLNTTSDDDFISTIQQLRTITMNYPVYENQFELECDECELIYSQDDMNSDSSLCLYCLNRGKSIMFIDTETTGLPTKLKGKYAHPSNIQYYNSSRIIEIAYIIKNNNKTTQRRFLIKPTFVIQNETIYGISIEDALDILNNDLTNVGTIVAHNIDFNINIILSEAYRLSQEEHEILSSVRSKIQICTMAMGRVYMNVKTSPSLVQLYSAIFGIEISSVCKTLGDARTCRDCYNEMVKKDK